MKLIALPLLVALAGFTPPQDNAEAKKKRLGEILNNIAKMQKEGEALLKELSGGDREKQDALMREIMEKYAPEMAAQFNKTQSAASERNGAFTLKTFATANADFRANDRDNNQINDFWVGDVSGLWRIDVDGAIKLIEINSATADARPLLPLDKEGALPDLPKTKVKAVGKASPKAGYWFAAIEKYQDETGAFVKYDQGTGRHTHRFGFCAYPAESSLGKMTFVITEDNTLYRKDTGGKPVVQWSSDPAKDGWQRYD